LYYRYSSDNASWGSWTFFGKDTSSPWSWSFTFPDGDGYYEFYSIANDTAGNTESAPSSADTICGYDTTAPTCTIEYNNSATYLKAGVHLRIYVNFTEATSGIDPTSVIINISTQGDGDLTNTSMTQTDNTHWYYDWTIPSGSDEDGTFTVSIYAKDNASNNLSPYPTTDSSKTIDNTPPTVSSLTVSDTLISDADAGSLFWVNITFSEAMDTSVAPTVTFGPSVSTTLTNAQGTWASSTVYRVNYTIADAGVDVDNIDVNVTSAKDVAGNTMTAYNGADKFSIDTQNPTLSYAVLDADNDGTNYTYIDVHFSEDLDASTVAYTDFSISTTGIDVAQVVETSGSRVTLRLNGLLRTGGSPTIIIDGSVADQAGNTLTSGSITINTYRISLNAGWNLISIPADTSNDLISTVISSISSNLQIIWTYDANTNTWSSWVNGDGDTFRLEPGKGYWIRMAAADTLVGNYNLTALGGTSPPYVTLKAQSWNLIGHWATYNQSASFGIYGALRSLSDDDVGALFTLTGPTTGYQPVLGQTMTPGKGYWLFLESTTDKLYVPNCST